MFSKVNWICMIKCLCFFVLEVSLLFVWLVFVVLIEFVVVELLLLLEWSECIEEEDDEEFVFEFEDLDEFGELYVFG